MRQLLPGFKKQHPLPEITIGTEDGLVLSRVPGPVREQVQYLWTRLHVHEGGVPHSIGVTSQLSGEGVSFVSQALAAVLARTSRTCLVETNWWRPGLPLKEQNLGLAGLMQGTAELDQTLIRTNLSNLSIMPAGEIPVSGPVIVPNTAEMGAVLALLRTRFEHIVLDLPAISTSATALSFAAATNASLLVVRQGVTRTAQVEAASEDLRHTRLLGVILNGNKVAMPSFPAATPRGHLMQIVLLFLAVSAIVGAASTRSEGINPRLLLAMTVVLTIAFTSRRFL